MGVLTILGNGVEDGRKLMKPLRKSDIVILVGKEKKESLKNHDKRKKEYGYDN